MAPFTEGFFDTDDYLALPRSPQPWIIENLIPANGLAMLYGTAKTGKSFAALGIAHAVAQGEASWLGWKVKRQGKVAYLQIDTSRQEWGDRIEKLKNNGYNMKGVYQADRLTSPYPFNILNPDHRKWLKTMMAALKPEIAVVDTLRESHNLDEDKSGAMMEVVQGFVEACDPATVLFVAHPRKGNIMNGDDIINDLRGSSYIPGKMDMIIKLTPKRIIWKGRAVEDGSKKISRHPITIMPILEDADEQLEEIILKMMADHPTKSMNWIATQVAEATKLSPKTITRRIKEITEKGIPVPKGDAPVEIVLHTA